MHILLTGSSGYIGSRLAPLLRGLGHSVAGVDRVRDDGSILDRFFHGDLLDAGLVDEALQDVDLVMHLAAAKGDWGISAGEFYRDNMQTTQLLLEKGRKQGIKDWVFYSSVAALGPSEIPLDEAAAFSPAIPYGASKADGEKLFQAFAAEDSEARIVIIRPSVVFGPGNPSSTNIYRLIEAIYNNRFVMIGQGDAVKTTSYIDNLLAATLFLLDRMAPGAQTFNYVDQPPKTTAELVDIMYELLDKKKPRWRLPLGVAYPLAISMDVLSTVTGKDLPITAARIKKFCTATNFDAAAIRRLGFEQPVSFEDSIRTTVEWHLREVAENV